MACQVCALNKAESVYALYKSYKENLIQLLMSDDNKFSQDKDKLKYIEFIIEEIIEIMTSSCPSCPKVSKTES